MHLIKDMSDVVVDHMLLWSPQQQKHNRIECSELTINVVAKQRALKRERSTLRIDTLSC